MRPEDIRRLYRQETEATAEEARTYQEEAKTDPDQARRLLMTLYALAGEDRSFAQLLQLVLQTALMQLVAIRASEDDQFALEVAALIIDGMESFARKVPRGKMRTAKSA